MTERDAAFTDYYARRAEMMRGTAFLLCGDWHRAEDLVQGAFTKLYLAWDRVDRHETLDGYVRRIIVHGYLDQRRRGWWRRERVTGAVPDRAGPADRAEDRLVLLQALERLPRRQRVVLVLRFWSDLSVADVADALDCSEGTVKSQTSRGLQSLRELLPPAYHPPVTATPQGT